MERDIVDRLREYACRGAVFDTNDMVSDAADKIELLERTGDQVIEQLGILTTMIDDEQVSAMTRLHIDAWYEARRG